MDAPVSDALEIDEAAWPIVVWKFREIAESPAAHVYLTRATTQAGRDAPHAHLIDVRGLDCPTPEQRRRLIEFVNRHRDHLQKAEAIAVVAEPPAFRFALSTLVLALPWLPPSAVHSRIGLAEAWAQRRLATREQRRLSTIPARSRDSRRGL